MSGDPKGTQSSENEERIQQYLRDSNYYNDLRVLEFVNEGYVILPEGTDVYILLGLKARIRREMYYTYYTDGITLLRDFMTYPLIRSYDDLDRLCTVGRFIPINQELLTSKRIELENQSGLVTRLSHFTSEEREIYSSLVREFLIVHGLPSKFHNHEITDVNLYINTFTDLSSSC